MTAPSQSESLVLIAYVASCNRRPDKGERALVSFLSSFGGLTHVRRAEGSSALDTTVLNRADSCILYVQDTHTIWAEMPDIAAAVPRASIILIFASRSVSYPDFQQRMAAVVGWQLPRLVWWESNYTAIQGAVWFSASDEPEVEAVGKIEWRMASTLNTSRTRTLVRILLTRPLTRQGFVLPKRSSSIWLWGLKFSLWLLPLAIFTARGVALSVDSNFFAQSARFILFLSMGTVERTYERLTASPQKSVRDWREHENSYLAQYPDPTLRIKAANLNAEDILRLAALQKEIFSRLGETECERFASEDAPSRRDAVLIKLTIPEINEYFSLRGSASDESERLIATENADFTAAVDVEKSFLSKGDQDRLTMALPHPEDDSSEDLCFVKRTLASHMDKLTGNQQAATARYLGF